MVGPVAPALDRTEWPPYGYPMQLCRFALTAALDRAIAAADYEEAEVRGKGSVPVIVRAA